MKLTPDDKRLLRSWHYIDSDIAQISDAILCTTYTVYATESKRGKRISADTAVKILGRKHFLSGIARSAFHFTAVRNNDTDVEIFFDSHKLFDKLKKK